MTTFEVIIKNIDEKLEQLKTVVCSERISSFDGYKRICGEIHGLTTAKEFILEVKHRLEHSDD